MSDQLALFDMRSPVEAQWRSLGCYPPTLVGPSILRGPVRINVSLKRVGFAELDGVSYRIVIRRWDHARSDRWCRRYRFRQRQIDAGADRTTALRVAERWHDLFTSRGAVLEDAA